MIKVIPVYFYVGQTCLTQTLANAIYSKIILTKDDTTLSVSLQIHMHFVDNVSPK